jgi:nucleotide-binding universal stress UspA family protein
MTRKILLGVDARHYAPEATEMARDLCHDSQDKIIVLHVHEFAIGRFGRMQVDCPEGDAEKLTDGIRMSLQNQGIDVDAEIREAHVGQIARSILQAAEEHDAHIIVLGSVRNTDLPHIPIGSVTHKVLHLARRPVMVVPRRAGS